MQLFVYTYETITEQDNLPAPDGLLVQFWHHTEHKTENIGTSQVIWCRWVNGMYVHCTVSSNCTNSLYINIFIACFNGNNNNKLQKYRKYVYNVLRDIKNMNE